MEQNTKANRLHALDGLRGVAIIMVFLSHSNASILNRSTFLGSVFFSSGVIGVSFLFILSGFLMAFLYPQPKNKLAFIQKRYTRIFPLFLSTCTTLFIFRFIPTQQWYIELGFFLLFALLTHIIWVYSVKQYFSQKYKKILFFTFVFFQISVAIFYLWVMQHPPIYYYQQMPHVTRSLTEWFVNATLTLPIGRYVNMFDPVYWSLAAEILFYLLYPYFCAPLIAYMSKRSRFSKILLLISLFPFFAGIAILSQHILYLSLLRFQLFYYFATGMALGYVYRKYPALMANINTFFPGIFSYVTILLFLGAIFLEHQIEFLYPGQTIFTQLIFALPFTLLLAIALANKTALASIFRSRILVYVGTVSYSIYLCHMFILNLAITVSGQPSSVITAVLYTLGTLIFTVIFSSILYFLLERPYFQRKVTEKKVLFSNYEQNHFIPSLYGTFSLVIILIAFVIYQTNLNFFTFKEPFYKSIISPNTNKALISLQQHPTIALEFIANQNNFGVLNLHLIHQTTPNKNKQFVPQEIDFRIKEKGSQHWYAVSQYAINGTTDILPIFYGFPLITNSNGKTYDILISQKVPSSSEYVLLDNSSNMINGIFFVDKKNLIKHPQMLFEFIENKIAAVIDNTEAQEVLLLLLPFIFFTFYLYMTDKRRLKFRTLESK